MMHHSAALQVATVKVSQNMITDIIVLRAFRAFRITLRLIMSSKGHLASFFSQDFFYTAFAAIWQF